MRSLADIDWARWTPTDRATLLFLLEPETDPSRILLIHKKRGLGAGKVNGPGGRLEPGETPEEAAVRELREELGIGAREVVEHGELSFQFVDGYALHCHVFRAKGRVGEPVETDEATPLWARLDAIPFERMWADDALWLPLLIAGQHFEGRFLFDGDAMLDHVLTAK